jgi:signal peptidase I
MDRGRSTGRSWAFQSRRAAEISDQPWESYRRASPGPDEDAALDAPPVWERPPVTRDPAMSPSGTAPRADEFAATRGAPPYEPAPRYERVTLSEPPPGEHKKAELLRFFGELPVLIALALGIALLIKAFLVQPFYIEQESMTPTLHPSERVLVSKLNYRFGDPARGDVVIFHNPRDPCDKNPDAARCSPGLPRRMLDWIVGTFGLPTGTSDDLVKRIVALPGETVAMQDGEVYVCQTAGCQPLNPDGTPKDGLLVAFAHTATKGPQKDNDDIEAVVVPKDQYYVLGDNRDGSVDSRVFGTVPRKDFVGKVVVLLWPPTRWQGL